jgi:acetylornithine deacetylase
MLEVLSGNQPTTISFGSEASHLRALTEECVVFGPGDMHVAHRTGEYVAEADLCKCVSYLKTTVESICFKSERVAGTPVRKVLC